MTACARCRLRKCAPILTQMVDLAPAAGAKVLLLGMRMPPNYGPEYTEQFRASFSDLAAPRKLPVVPFLLNDIALSRNLMQADEIHPERSRPAACCSSNVWPALQAAAAQIIPRLAYWAAVSQRQPTPPWLEQVPLRCADFE